MSRWNTGGLDINGTPKDRHRVCGAPERTADERGAGTLEYLGIAVVAAVIILALVAVPWLPQITAGFNNTICRITSNLPGGISCEEQDPMTEEEYQPRCVLSRGSQSGNINGSVVVVDESGGASMAIEERSDGDYAVTLMDEHGIGLSFELLKVQAGPLLDISAGAGGMGHENEGETWVFDSEDEALAFAEETQEYVDANGSFLELGGMFHSRPGEDMTPQVTREVHSVEAFANANAQVGFGGKKRGNNNDRGNSDGGSGSGQGSGGSSGSGQGSSGSGSDGDTEGGLHADWLPQFSAGADISGEMVVEVDHGDDLDDPADDTRTFTFGTGRSANAGANVGDLSEGSERAASSSMSVETDKDGKIVGVTFREGTITSDTDFDADVESTNWTTEIEIDSESDREVVANWLTEGGEIPSAEGVREQPASEGSAQSEFEELMYESGVTSQETHAVTSDNGGWDVGLKVSGIGGGFGESSSSTSEQLMDAQYLAPPDSPGGTRSMESTPC